MCETERPASRPAMWAGATGLETGPSCRAGLEARAKGTSNVLHGFVKPGYFVSSNIWVPLLSPKTMILALADCASAI